MIQEDQVFITDVVVINPTRKPVALIVISWPASATAKLNAIVKIRKCRRLQKGHHFILMAMEVHDTPGCDMDHFIKECVGLFHDR
jgi:hypothetical protein